MYIAFDGYSAVYDNKQGDNYSRQLIDALSALYEHNQHFIYSPTLIDNSYLTPIIIRRNVHAKVQRNKLSKFMWRNVGGVLQSVKRHRIEVFHGLCSRLPLRIGKADVKSVVTFEDLGEINTAWKRFMARKACAHAHAVVAFTQQARQELITHYGANADNVIVIPPAIPDIFIEHAKESFIKNAREHYKLPEKYILIDSFIDSNSHALEVLKAIKLTEDETLGLVLNGHCDHNYMKQLKEWAASHGMTNRLVHVRKIRTVLLPGVTADALISIVPERSGAFPYGATRAQAAGTPLIAAPQLNEIAGDGAMYIDLSNVEDVKMAITRILADDNKRTQLIADGHVNAQNYTTQAMAQAHIDLYKNLLG